MKATKGSHATVLIEPFSRLGLSEFFYEPGLVPNSALFISTSLVSEKRRLFPRMRVKIFREKRADNSPSKNNCINNDDGINRC